MNVTVTGVPLTQREFDQYMEYAQSKAGWGEEVEAMELVADEACVDFALKIKPCPFERGRCDARYMVGTITRRSGLG